MADLLRSTAELRVLESRDRAAAVAAGAIRTICLVPRDDDAVARSLLFIRMESQDNEWTEWMDSTVELLVVDDTRTDAQVDSQWRASLRRVALTVACVCA